MDEEIESFISERKREIFHQIKDQTKIYLDTKFWIRLRDQSLSDNFEDKELLNLVTSLASSGKCIFPVSETIFWEILKQKDLRTLYETLKLADLLSKGIAISKSKELLQIEIAYLYDQRPDNLQNCIWTNSVFVVCNILEFLLEKTVPSSSQTGFYHLMSKFSLSDAVKLVNLNKEGFNFEFRDNVHRMNSDNAKHADENNSFEGLFLSELNGLIEHNEESFTNVLANDFEQNCRRLLTLEQRKAHFQSFKNHILHGFQLGKLKRDLASITVFANLHAAHRSDRFRQHKDGNDTMDFFHASFALPYYEYFFTEKRLANLIKLWKFDEYYSCRVVWQEKEIIEILKSLENVNR